MDHGSSRHHRSRTMVSLLEMARATWAMAPRLETLLSPFRRRKTSISTEPVIGKAAILVLDARGLVRSVNETAEALFGWSRAEVVGEPVDELLASRARRTDGIRVVAGDGRLHVPQDVVGLRRSGEVFPVELSTAALPEDGPSRFVLSVRDLGHQHRADPQWDEEQLFVRGLAYDVTSQKEAESRFRRLLETAPDAMVIVDDTGSIVLGNVQAENLFGYSPDELVGQPVEMLIPDRYHGAHEEHRRHYFADPRVRPMGTGLELYAKCKDGTEVPVEISLGPLVTERGTLVSSAIRDVTERKRAEDDLRRTTEQVKASLADKEVLLKEIHHRVKNNLQVISSLLKLQASSVADDATLNAFQDAQSRIRSMSLVHEKLYSRGNQSQVDFGEYARSLASLLMRTYQSKARVRLDFDVEPVPIGIQYAVPLGLILNEVVSNALKYAFPEDRPGTIRIAFGRSGPSELRLTVADDGPGLPEGADMHSNSSLGLTLVHTLTDQLKGRLEITSREGACFSLTFPEETRP